MTTAVLLKFVLCLFAQTVALSTFLVSKSSPDADFHTLDAAFQGITGITEVELRLDPDTASFQVTEDTVIPQTVTIVGAGQTLQLAASISVFGSFAAFNVTFDAEGVSLQSPGLRGYGKVSLSYVTRTSALGLWCCLEEPHRQFWTISTDQI